MNINNYTVYTVHYLQCFIDINKSMENKLK